VVSVCLLEILPSHPPNRKPFAREPAPGSEVVWRKRGLGEIRNGLRDLLRAAAVRGLDSIAESFMRSIVENEHDHALRFAKHFLGGGFYQGHLTISTHSTRRARWSSSTVHLSALKRVSAFSARARKPRNGNPNDQGMTHS
jgi:hypothetical protein